MLFYATWYTAILLVNFFFLITIAIYLYRRRSAKGAYPLHLCMMVAAIWALMEAMDSSIWGAENKILASKLAYLGIAFVGPFWLLFNLEFTQGSEKVIRFLKALLFPISIAVIGIVFTNDFHHLFWNSTTIVNPLDGFSNVTYTHGVLWYANIAFQYLNVIIGSIIFLVYGLKQTGTEKRMILYTLVAVMFPLIADMVYNFSPLSASEYDFTPISFMFMGIFLSTALFRKGYYDLVIEAKDKIIDEMDLGIVITNKTGQIVSMNSYAQKVLGTEVKPGTNILQSEASQRLLSDQEVYVPDMHAWIDFSKTDLHTNQPIEQGAIYYIQDVTKQKQEKDIIQQSEYKFRTMIDFFPDAVFAVDMKGDVIVWNNAMENLSGRSAAQMMGQGEYAYAVPFYKKKRPMLLDIVREGLAIEKYFPGEDIVHEGEVLSLETKGDDGKVLLAIAKPLYDNKKQKMGAIEIIRDITHQRKNESELRERLDTLDRMNDIMIRREERLKSVTKQLEKKDTEKTSIKSNAKKK